LLGVDEVTPYGVLQIGTPVQLHRPGDVTMVVSLGVFVDLDEDDVVDIEIALGPVSGDQDVGACHAGILSIARTSVLRSSAVGRLQAHHERVELAAQADAERRVEE
jgi:hypothetical protein